MTRGASKRLFAKKAFEAETLISGTFAPGALWLTTLQGLPSPVAARRADANSKDRRTEPRRRGTRLMGVPAGHRRLIGMDDIE